MTLQELRTSILVVGPPQRDDVWDEAWRLRLVDNLEELVSHLDKVGITEVFVDGSFCQNNPHPNDIDGYFLCDRKEYQSGRLEQALTQIDQVWTWDDQYRRPDQTTGEMQLPMWHKYRVELWPDVGQPCGIVDENGKPQRFSTAFRQTRDFKPRGIIKLR